MATVTILHNVSDIHDGKNRRPCGRFFGTCSQCSFEKAYSYTRDVNVDETGNVPIGVLEEIYTENQGIGGTDINVQHQERSLSVGDIVEIGIDNPHRGSEYRYQVADFGFEPVSDDVGQ